MTDHFKICPLCSKGWAVREDFLKDRDIELIGYQVDFQEVARGLLLFNHNTCKTTLAIPVNRVRDLYLGPVFNERKTGQDECPAYCLRRSALEPCQAECECAWVRNLLQIIQKWPKSDTSPRVEKSAAPEAIDEASCREADHTC